MPNAGLRSCFMFDRGKRLAGIIETALDHGDPRRAIVVVAIDDAIERGAIEIAVVDELEEIPGCHRRLVDIQVDADVALACRHHDPNRALIGVRRIAAEQRDDREQLSCMLH